MNSKEVYDYILKIQSIAKIGLVFSKDPYALTNYKEINDLSTKFLEDFNNVKLDRNNYFERDIYPTPGVSARTIIFNEEKTKVLLVREVNSHQYSLPGGWCDLYDSPADTAKAECIQEAGALIKDLELVGVCNRTPFISSTGIPNYVIIFKAKLDKLQKEHEYETDDVNFFDINNLPEISRKTSKDELLRFINAAKDNKVIFD